MTRENTVNVPRLPMKVAIANAIWELDRGQTTNARVEMCKAQDILSAAPLHEGEGDSVDLLDKAIAALRGHVSAVQEGKAASKRGELSETNPIIRCINALPEIVRWLDAAKFEIECAFEKYEDAAPASVEVEKMAAVMRGMLRRGTVIDGDAISRAARLATYQQDPNDEDRRWADEQAQALSRKQEPGGKG